MMTDAMGRSGMRLRMSGISRIVAWIKELRRRETRALQLDIRSLPDDRLRDIGLLDGRGPSLRRPEQGRGGSEFDRWARPGQ